MCIRDRYKPLVDIPQARFASDIKIHEGSYWVCLLYTSYLAEGAKFYEKLCPAPVTPKHLIKALKGNHKRKSELLYGSGSHHPITGWFFSTVLGLWAFAKTVLMLFKPRMSPAISDAFAHMDETSELQLESSNPPLFENNLCLLYTSRCV